MRKRNIHFDGKNAIFRHKTSFAMQLTAEQPQNSQYYSLFPSNKSYSRKEYKLACGTSAARFKKFRRKVKLLRAVNICFPLNKSYFRKKYGLACVVSAAKRKLSLELSLYTFQRARLALPSAMVAVPKTLKAYTFLSKYVSKISANLYRICSRNKQKGAIVPLWVQTAPCFSTSLL